MVKISIVKKDFKANISKASSSVSTLEGSKLTATDLNGTSLGPFIQLVDLEKSVSSTVDKYSKMANGDTKQYTKVDDTLDKEDTTIANSFSK